MFLRGGGSHRRSIKARTCRVGGAIARPFAREGDTHRRPAPVLLMGIARAHLKMCARSTHPTTERPYGAGSLRYSTVPSITAGQERNSRSGSHFTELPSRSVAVTL